MSLPKDLLATTESRAPGIGVYGGPGLKKSHAICTLPPPVLAIDIGEGGSASYLPWISRRRNWNERGWTTYTQEQRQRAFDLLHEQARATVALSPNPYVDLIHFDNMEDSYDQLVQLIGNFDASYYNSFALDSLQELSIETQTKGKLEGGGRSDDPMQLKYWATAQERAGILLRKLRNYRDQGVFLYLVGSEDISKDYVKDPREKKQGEQPPEPYNIRGTVNLPGKLASGLSHLPDILLHARMLNNQIVWVSTPESLPGGQAHWDAKDRYGRLPSHCQPNIRTLCDHLYGKEGRQALYAVGIKVATGSTS